MALTRDEILDAALGILDQYGLADLTMRRVATQLGVQAGALYWHVPNKQALLSGLADRILADVALPAPEASVGEALVEWGSGLRGLLLQHRNGAELLSAALAMRPWSESPAAALANALSGKGLDATHAQVAASTAQSLVVGHVLDEEQRNALAELKLAEPADVASGDRLAQGLALLAGGLLC